jgi:hypothetical protein
LGFKLDKKDSVRLSELKSPLSKTQQEYAARDAWTSLLIFLEVNWRKADMESFVSPLNNNFHETSSGPSSTAVSASSENSSTRSVVDDFLDR